jgi:hypothetical protein
MKGPPSLLTINGGSSNIRFGVYEAGDPPRRQPTGTIDRIGSSGATLTVTDPAGAPQRACRLPGADHRTAAAFLLDWLEAQSVLASVDAVGHRVVCATRHAEAARITPGLLAELRGLAPYNADYLPREIGLIDGISRRRRELFQVACFDTAFHRTMPRVARLLPIPRRYTAKGIERYGFRGLSFSYSMEELGRLDPRGAHGRVILAHLLPWLGLFGGLTVIYRLAPSRVTTFAEVWIGALIATGLIGIGELLFHVYAVNFGHFRAYYGTLGGIVAFLLWIYVASCACVFGTCVCAARAKGAGDAGA